MRKLAFILLLGIVLSACQGDVTPTPDLPATVTPTPPSVETQNVASLQPTAPISTIGPTAPISTPTPNSSINVTPADLKGIQLTFWHPWSGDLSQAIDAAVAEFNRTNIWGITVQSVSQGSLSALDTALSNPAPGSALPQVIAMPPEYIASNPAAIPLDSYLGDRQWGLSAQEVADYYPAFWNEGQTSPRISLPILRTMAVLYYNQSWAKDLKFSQAPATPDAFKAQACAAGKAVAAQGNPDTNGTGGWIINTSSSTVYSWLAAYNAVPQAGSDTAPMYDSSNSEQAFTSLRKLDDTGCAWSSRNPSPYEYFAGRQALFFSGTLEDMPSLAAAMAYQKNSDTWTVLPYPTDASQPPLVTFGSSLAILQSTPREQLASWLFISWLELPRVQAELAAAGWMLPARKSALDLMVDFAKANPHWAVASGWLSGKIQPLPVQAWWKVTQRVLEDGAGQVFAPFLTIDKVPDVLKETDATIAELLKR